MSEQELLDSVRGSYDVLARDLHEQWDDELAARPLERALIGAFAEEVRATGLPVLDAGCGTGRVTPFLHGLGVPVSGVDLSPGMVEVAREKHPGIRFDVGSILALDVPDGSLCGVLAWYSIIHLTDEQLPRAFAEFARVLAPGGQLLLAFQCDGEPLVMTEALGHPVRLTFHRRDPDQVVALLAEAGFAPRARTVRERLEHERTRQAFVLAARE
ncbi:class I SAM-dependent methyltransferase [Streptomyces purpureus]|uniref:Methyltransferase n=1 Tax=Streptomyces purpureus TaxID=1951 RepID=A0A918H0W4_9ACTN|nr:class I SAM-dependent methyltransferase [Streptomyces purpureus]GGT29298.1 methyltransferase [Streptomyces purpureus]